MNTSKTTSAGLLNLLFGCVFLFSTAMPQAAAQVAAVPDCSSTGNSFAARFPVPADSVNQVKKIQAQLFSSGYHPGKIDGFRGPDTDWALEQFCRSIGVDQRFQEQIADTEAKPDALAEILIELLEKTAGAPDKPNRILLSGGGCGCSRDYKENSLVYGFYPHRLADGKEHVVDFSLFDRIGFYALELDQQGSIKHDLQWPRAASRQPNVADFIRQAHKHEVEVDVTFYASNWQSWEGGEDKQIDRATNNIVDTVTREFVSDMAPRWRKFIPFISNYPTARADGINLFFDNYNDFEQRESWQKLSKFVDGAAVSEKGSLLVEIVKELSRKLKQAESDAKLNLVLGLNLAYVDKLQLDVEKDSPPFVDQYRRLEAEFRFLEWQFKALEEILDADQKMVDNVFVFLTQDTIKSKKNLRQIVENAFEGAARQTVLRKIVPIVVVQGLAEQDVQEVKRLKEQLVYGDSKTQFKDDLIYMQNNFAGIGLWHLPLTPGKEDSDKEIATLEIAENEAAELAAAAEEAAAAAQEAVDRATAAAGAVKNALKHEAAAEEAAQEALKHEAEAMKQAEEHAKVEMEIAKQEAANKAEAAKEKTAAMEATKKKIEAPQEDVEALREALKTIYQVKGEFAFPGKTIAPYADSLCEYACPNRWRFYTAIGILLALAVIYTLLALRYCRLREFYQRRFIYFAGFGFVIVAIVTVTMICDQFLRQRAVFVLISILLLIMAAYGLRRMRKTMRPQLP